MADRVVLHVGAMKSGTSYIQAQLFANKALLGEQGVLVPGQHWGHQVTGVLDVLGRLRYGRESVAGHWQRIVDEVDEWPGTAVVSMEFLGPISRDKIARVVAGFPDSRVSVVLAARDLNRSIAAMWQETIQNGRWWTWQEYLAGVERARPRPERSEADITKAGRTFWRQQNTVRMSRSWGQAPGVADYTFLTVPAPGAPPELLMERFADVVGFDAGSLQPGQLANESVGAASAEMLRRVNAVLADQGLEFPLGAPLRKHDLAKRILAARSRQEQRAGLDVADWVRPYARQMVEELQALGVRLVGDWHDLEPVAVPGVDPGAVAEAEVRAAADDGLRGLLPLLEKRFGAEWTEALQAADTDGAVERLAGVLARAIRAGSDSDG